MSIRSTTAAKVAALLLLSACGAEQVTSTAVPDVTPRQFVATPTPTVRFSEVHYDNNSTDANERIEVSLPSGQSIADYRVVLYNGANGQSYANTLLSTGVRSACTGGARDVIVLSYPVNGIQNGDPDGMALIDGAGNVLEFLSYEGVFAATNGPAVGLTSTSIGAAEGGTGGVNGSIARNTAGTWVTDATTNSFGSCNDGTGGGPVAGPIASVSVAPATATVSIGGTQTLTATARDAAGTAITSATFTWSTADATIATVSASGVVTGVAPGVVVITATSSTFSGTATITVSEPATLPTVRFTEIHYDNSGEDFGEALEIEGPAGTDLTGWQVLLYNGTNGRVYDTRALTGTIPATCSGRGVIVLEYSTGLLQNGAPDGMALVNAAGTVVEFLSYEGVVTATDGPAAGTLSRNIGVAQNGAPVNTSLQRSLLDTWSSAQDSFGTCNGRGARLPRTTLAFGFRTPFDPALPVGFEDLLTVTKRVDGANPTFDTPLVSETPAIAEVLANNVIRGVSAGTARFRATTPEGFTLTYELPVRVAAAGPAVYANHLDFGTPTDGTPSDDFVVTRDQMAFSYSNVRNTPNWVAYNLEATHVGDEDRCDCFTFDPALPSSFTRYSTFDYVGSGYSRGHLVKSQDRTSGSLDNARTFYFSNIVPQTSANNSGPWLQLENYLTDKARVENKEVFIVAGVAGNIGTLNGRGVVTIPGSLWKVAIVLPKDRGLADVNAGLVPDEVIAVIMPNAPSMPSPNWRDYSTTVDAVELLSGYNVLDRLNDQIEIALESNTKPPIAQINGPFEILAGETVALSAAGSTDPDEGDVLSYFWQFGDGSNGSGLDVTHRYLNPGSYTVTLTVRDQRELLDEAQTTVLVLTDAGAVERAADRVEALATAGRLNRGLANSLAAKLRAAAASVSRESVPSAVGQLGALVNELNALVQAEKLTEADVAPVRALLERVIVSLQR